MNSRPLPELTDGDVERLWLKVDVKNEHECWPWIGSKDQSGYGKIKLGPKRLNNSFGAHRILCLLTHGQPKDPRMLAMHVCDNPSCCNPAHLRWGTDSDNTRDMVAKGRMNLNPRRGERHSSAIFTDAEVLAMREAYRSGERVTAIARRLGVGHPTVSLIVQRKHWRHLP